MLARKTIQVVMPRSFEGLRRLFSHSSHMTGITELTWITIKATTAFGQNFAQASTMFFAMPALMFNKPLRSCPGFWGAPVGTSTKWQTVRPPVLLMALLSLSNAYAFHLTDVMTAT